MHQLYNSTLNARIATKTSAKVCGVVLVALLVGLGLANFSCRRRPPEPVNPSPASDKESAATKVSEADQLYRLRSNLGNVRQGIAILRQARIADYGNYEAAWKLAKFSYYLGAHTDAERERDMTFREGVDAGKAAVQLAAARPEGHFWLGANYGGSAEHSTLAGLSSVEDIRSEMETVLKIDEGYQSGSAYLALGQLYLRAPKLLGGDNAKALEYLEKGLKFGRHNALLRANLAEAYHAVNRDAEARKQIDFVLSMTSDPEYLPEYNEAVAQVKKLLEKLNR